MTDTDKKEMNKVVFGAVIDALEQVVFPKFDTIDEKFEKIDQKFAKIDARFDSLEQLVDDMENHFDARLSSVEHKIDNLTDNSQAIKNHEIRITNIEKSLA